MYVLCGKEEGRGQCIRHLLLKFSSEYDQRHYLQSPPSTYQSTVYADSVGLGVGGGVLSRVGDHILQEFYTLYVTRFRTYKIVYLKQITSF